MNTSKHPSRIKAKMYKCLFLTLYNPTYKYSYSNSYNYVKFRLSHLSACDYLGERMASLFGITSAKYQYAIDEYSRSKREVRQSFILV